MNGENNETCHERDCGRNKWGLLGLAAVVGIAAAAMFVLSSRTRRRTSAWSIDDLIDAADKAACDLESRLLGERASA